MDSTDFNGIHVVDSNGPFPKDQYHGDELTRRKPNNGRVRSKDETELDKLRKLVEEVESERRESGGYVGCQKGSIEPSLMGTVFGVVLAIIITITVYAFTSLYQALSKKYYQ